MLVLWLAQHFRRVDRDHREQGMTESRLADGTRYQGAECRLPTRSVCACCFRPTDAYAPFSIQTRTTKSMTSSRSCKRCFRPTASVSRPYMRRHFTISDRQVPAMEWTKATTKFIGFSIAWADHPRASCSGE